MKKIIKKALPKIIGTSLNTISHVAPKYASTKALNLFATPRKGRLTDKHKSFLDNAEQSTLKYQDYTIQTYQWKGEKQTVLLAHGWESNTYRWKSLINTLHQDGHHIIALDAPAHGQSSGTQFNAILYSEFINIVAAHYQPTVIVGHSVGGMASVFFQYKYQLKSIKKLVLLGAPSEFTKIFKNYVNMLSYNRKIENGLNRLILDKYDNEPAFFSSANFSKDIEAKGLIIHDKSDKIIDYEDAELIAKHYKNSTLKTTEGLGHSLKHDSIDDDILNFINN